MACRAGTTTATAFGSSLSSTQANFNGEEPYNGAAKGPNLGKTAVVGSYNANAWGLYDMHGNVGEWCRDWYTGTLSGGRNPAVSQPGEATSRVLRGGSWGGIGGVCRSASRFRSGPAGRYYYFGFRVAGVRSGS